MRSLRRDLLVSLAIGVGAADLLGGAVVHALFRAHAQRDFDRALATKAGVLGTLLRRTDDGVEFEFADEVMPEFHRPADPEYFELWHGDAVLERSRSLGAGELPRQVGSPHAPRWFDLELPDGRAGRAVGLRCIADFGDERPVDRGAPPVEVDLVVAVSRDALAATERWIAQALLLAGGALLLAGGAAVAWAVRRAAGAVDAVARGVGTLGSAAPGGAALAVDPARRLVELEPLVVALEGAFARVGEALERERRMTSNIAHELRTPIAELRTAAEVARQWPDDAESTQRAIAAVAEIAARMTATIESLLRLGRLDAGGYPLDLAAIDVAAAVAATVADESRITHRGAGEAVVRADGPLVRALVRNVAANALDHSPPGTPVTSELRRRRRVVRWTVVNRVEPDAARDGHHGLGLSLCHAICRALGWRLLFRVADGRRETHLFLRDARTRRAAPVT